MKRKGILEQYSAYLPPLDERHWVTLYEGSTPLLPLNNLPKALGVHLDIYVKFEGLNPTGSFKDRGMTLAVSGAKASGSKILLCASTGNTSASAAAYAARAGMKAYVLLPAGKIAQGKLVQAMVHGATILQIDGNFDAAMDIVTHLSQTLPVTLVNSINPLRLQGQQTASFEVVDALGQAPDYHALPVGNAGNITAYWMGYKKYHALGKSQLPKMLGYQASGAAPFVQGSFVDAPETIATAIRIGHPTAWKAANEVQQGSQGWFNAVTDDEILTAQRWLATLEGVFCEPAAATGIAGLVKDYRAGKLKENATVVCTLTGHGLKDPQIILQNFPALQVVPAEESAIAKIIMDGVK